MTNPQTADRRPVADTAPASASASAARRSGRLHTLRHDYAYILPGFPLGLIAFVLLIPLTALSIGTLILWFGAFLLTLTLTIATAFAELSRARLRTWGIAIEPVPYRAPGTGITGVLRSVADPRRWMDLAFETLVAFPLRLATFVVTVSWTLGAAAGLTSFLWTWAIPGPPAWTQLLEVTIPGVLPALPDGQYILSASINFVLGLFLLLTLPVMVGSMARLDASVTAGLLGGDGRSLQPGTPHRPTNTEASASTASRPATAWNPSFSGRAWTWLAVSVAAAALAATGWPLLATVHGLPVLGAMVLGLGYPAALVLAVRSPTAGLGLATFCAVGTVVATHDAAGSAPWPWPITALLAHCALLTLLSLRYRWPWPVAGWAVAAGLTISAWTFDPRGLDGNAIVSGVVMMAVGTCLVVLGILVRLWFVNTRRIREVESLSADEVRRRRELQDRTRIARELHDVVAHSMSVITVQATTARYRTAGVTEEIQAEFDDIASSSRRALREMRELLGILRGEDDAPTTPLPDMTDLDSLVQSTRTSGAEISYARHGGDVPATVGLTAYRVVQEALSNALRHAPGSSIEVEVSVDEAAVTIHVENSPAPAPHQPSPGSGLGLSGLHERVTALGGHATAEPTERGGFIVRAQLPIT